jgi:transmembrane sensor
MNSADDKLRDLIAEQAAEWLVANREGLTAQERQAFVAWLQTSPVHIEEYLAHSTIAADMRKACELSDDALSDLLARARAQPDPISSTASERMTTRATQVRVLGWWPAAMIAASAAVVGMTWFGLETFWPIMRGARQESVAEFRMSTGHGEQRSLRLIDNTIVHLNTDSTVIIRYSDLERVVTLQRGEADFEVVHEPRRTFRVVAGSVQVIDVGTKFDVHVGRDTTVVTVVEGDVAVSPVSDGQGAIPIGANHQITVVDGSWPPAKPIAVDAQRTTAWIHRQIVFNNAALDKVAAEFNRYALKPIVIVTPGLQKLEISGIFATDDTAAFIAFLRSLDSVRVQETDTQIRVSGNPK